MNRYGIVCAAVVALVAGSASSAEQCFDKATLKYVDCPQPAQPVVAPLVAPEPEPVALWAGPYVGAQAGYGWASADGEFGGNGGNWSPVGGEAFEVDGDGFLVGAHAGYLWQFDRIVVGPELYANWSGVEGDETSPYFPASDTFSMEMGWNAGAVLRAGYEVAPAWLVYGKGGYSAANVEATLDDVVGFVIKVQEEEVLHGFTLGAGVEHQISDDIRLGVEYGYSQYFGGEIFETAGPTDLDYDVDLHSVQGRLSIGF